jgi:hypothetical protein
LISKPMVLVRSGPWSSVSALPADRPQPHHARRATHPQHHADRSARLPCPARRPSTTAAATIPTCAAAPNISATNFLFVWHVDRPNLIVRRTTTDLHSHPTDLISAVTFSNPIMGAGHDDGASTGVLRGIPTTDDHVILAQQRCRGPTGVLYGGVDGLICEDRGSLRPHVPAATAAWSPYRTVVHDDDMEMAAYGSAEARTPPRFYKLEFATYDGSEDPLNWLNHCEQFFRGQRTPASDRTWLASYHLKGPAQTWYYALEQDEGMLPWERFVELCRLRFGPAVRGSRLAELGRLPFLSTVQEYADRFQALLCQARDISPP